MLIRALAIVLLALLAVVPAAAGSSSFSGGNDCRPDVHGVVVDLQVAKTQAGCDHPNSHCLIPCAMSGLCSVAGCATTLNSDSLEVLSTSRGVIFRALQPLPLHGLHIAPLLEPPRA
jgi:hypothetical protein